jgi:lipopolysaccharide export system permease protein
MNTILNRYLVSRFLTVFGLLLFGVYGLILMFDSIELNRSLDSINTSITEILVISAMRAPSIMLKAMPFVVLLSVMISYARLARNSEITVMRASGVSSRGLIFSVILASIVLGIMTFSLFHPIAAWFLDRSQDYELHVQGDENSRDTMSVSTEGIWLRQGTKNFQTIIHAQSASAQATHLKNVTFYRFSKDDILLERLDAQNAVLNDAAHAWNLTNVTKLNFSESGVSKTQTFPSLDIETNLTPQQIEDSFSDPGTVPFWGLRKFINSMEESGLHALRHILYFQTLLSLPLTYASMVIIAAAFSMRPRRFGGLGFMALSGVICGFVYYFIQDVSLALGGSGTLSPILAVWTPPLSAFLLGVGLFLHMEDT